MMIFCKGAYTKRILITFLISAQFNVVAAFYNRGNSNDNGELIQLISQIIEKNHYRPKAIDDHFSKELFKKYIAALDPLKGIFLQKDIDSLKRFEYTLDNEVHGTEPFTFVSVVHDLYIKRLNEALSMDRQLLSVPFQFDVDEEVNTNGSSADNFATSEDALKEVRRKMLKYLAIQYFAALQERNKQYNDATLEKAARQKSLEWREQQYGKLLQVADEDHLFSLFVNTIMHLMDPHTDYISPDNERGFAQVISNRYWGIGIQLADNKEGASVEEVQPNSPAANKGIVVNDIITQVGQGTNGKIQDVKGMSAADIANLVYGEKGTTVRLTVKRPDDILKTIVLIRTQKDNAGAFVKAAIIQEQGKRIGYISLPSFYSDSLPGGAHCADDVAKALTLLNSEKVDGVVFDLRNNPGGSLLEVLHMVGLMVNGGPIVQVKNKTGKPGALRSLQTKPIYAGPLTVLVNERTASAAEIFTAAIQDYHRGIIIGSRTYGKGTVQRTFPLGKNNGFLKLTFEQFFRINGSSTQIKGVMPDIVLPDIYAFQKVREKDNANALNWDSIPPAVYKIWNNAASISGLQRSEQDRLSRDTVFDLISRNNTLLAQQEEKKVNLYLPAFKTEMADKQRITARNKALLTLPLSERLNVISVDSTLQSSLKEKWLKGISMDIYIAQAIQVMNDMLAMKEQASVHIG